MPPRSLGYRLELENHSRLAATAAPFVLTQAYTAPKTVRHREWRAIKDQNGMGACTGFSRASGEEILNWIGTNGQVLTLSSMYAYLQSQKACGLWGADQGATIDGSVRAAAETGICREELFPFPGRYVTDIPAAATEEGRLHLIRSHSVLRSYDEIYRWLSSGVGVVLIGIPWLSGLTRAGATIEKRDLHGSELGGHAMLLEGYDGNRTDGDGRPYLDLENSHSARWGEGGWSLVAPAVIEYWLRQGTFIGISDLATFAPRRIKTYKEWLG